MINRACIALVMLVCMATAGAQSVTYDFTGVGQVCTASSSGFVCEENQSFTGTITFDLLAPGPSGPDSETDGSSIAWDDNGWVQTSFVIQWNEQAFISGPVPDMYFSQSAVYVMNNFLEDRDAPWRDRIDNNVNYASDSCGNTANLVRRTTDTTWLDSLDFDLYAGMAPGVDATNEVGFYDSCSTAYNERIGDITLTSFVPRMPGAVRVGIEVLRKSNALVTVAVMGSAEFDAAQVDPQKAQLGPRHAAPVGAVRIADVNRDGYADALLKFRARETGIRGEHRAVLKGETYAGQRFYGIDRLHGRRGGRF